MILLIILTFLGLTTQVIQATDEGHCIWYGECFKDNAQVKNCPYDGPAKPLDEEGKNIFIKHCPHMVKANENDPKTCCDTKQLKKLDTDITILTASLKKCPSCHNNLKKHICEFVCSPHQSKFMNVTMSVHNSTTDVTYINGIEIYLTQKYIDDTYESCKKVTVSPGNDEPDFPALDLFCAEYGAENCTSKRLFDSLGDSDNPYIPFQINYIPTDKPIGNFIPLNPEITPCNKAIDENTPACSCTDCPASCSKE